jgi:spore coat polysaccharide biosynthesis protein SpsF
MTQRDVIAFVQARMSSSRFPGKVLAPFRGEPIVLHVVRAAADAVGEGNVVVATSTERSDDPLAAYLESIGVPCFRGPRDDVLERFRLCARAFRSEWVLRLCADSPLLDPRELRAVLEAASPEHDVVSTALGPVATPGRNAELIRTATLLSVDPDEASPEEREHVTPFFYRHPERFRLHGVELPAQPEPRPRTVDTVDDLARLEACGSA